VEKPFGHDLASARELSGRLHEVFNESEVYRIDHYLGKETVQNILAFRFGNGIFEPLWNRRNSVAGQYGPARVGGQDVAGFRQEPGVDPQSPTDTYAAITLFVENWRWAGVPFYVRTGKRMHKPATE